jgi:ubiquinone biosynthesis protein COQ4
VDNKEVAMEASVSATPGPSELPFDDMPTWPRIARGLRALRQLRDDPNDTVLALRAALLLNTGALARTLRTFESTEEGRDVLARRPALDHEHVDLDALLALPEGTLGQAYAAFMKSRGLTPEVFVPPREIRDEHRRYIGQRLRQTHDLWHVVTGYETDVAGEVELQAFTFGQLHTPFAFFVALGGLQKSLLARRSLLSRLLRAYWRGRRAKALCYRAWEARFESPLAEVRTELALA